MSQMHYTEEPFYSLTKTQELSRFAGMVFTSHVHFTPNEGQPLLVFRTTLKDFFFLELAAPIQYKDDILPV